MTDEEKKQALAAAGILQNDVFLDAMSRLDARYVSAWRTAKNAEDRESYWYRQSLLAEFEAELFSEIQSAAVKTCGRDEQIKAALTTVKAKRRRNSNV